MNSNPGLQLCPVPHLDHRRWSPGVTSLLSRQLKYVCGHSYKHHGLYFHFMLTTSWASHTKASFVEEDLTGNDVTSPADLYGTEQYDDEIRKPVKLSILTSTSIIFTQCTSEYLVCFSSNRKGHQNSNVCLSLR